MSNKTLSKRLKFWRADRPDEWTMDEFIRDAEALEWQLNDFTAKLVEVNKFCQKRGIGKIGDSAVSALMQRHDELAAQVERLRYLFNDLFSCHLNSDYLEVASKIRSVLSKQPPSLTAELMAQWQTKRLIKEVMDK